MRKSPKNNSKISRNEKSNSEDVERWPSDKYFEQNPRDNKRGGEFSQRNFKQNDYKSGGYHQKSFKQNDGGRGGNQRQFKQNHDDGFMDSRRLQRELICEQGNALVWGHSPTRPVE